MEGPSELNWGQRRDRVAAENTVRPTSSTNGAVMLRLPCIHKQPSGATPKPITAVRIAGRGWVSLFRYYCPELLINNIYWRMPARLSTSVFPI